MAGDTDNTKTVCFDLDGTLCTNTYGEYDTAEPFPWAIERLNALAEAGHRIVVFTARGTATGIDWTDVTRGQLDSWGVRYDDVKLGKPSADVYVDDRAVHTTAWREGDAYAVPGFGLPMPAGRPEELPGVLATQRTTVVESGRTWGGRPLLAAGHVDRLLRLARAAEIAEVPDADAVHEALDEALARAAEPEVVFTIALADDVTPAFQDLAEERVGGPVVTVRALAQAMSVPRPEGGSRGRLAAAVGGGLALAPGGGLLGDLLPELAGEAGIEVREQPLDATEAEAAGEVFEAVDALGLVPVRGATELRDRLERVMDTRSVDNPGGRP